MCMKKNLERNKILVSEQPLLEESLKLPNCVYLKHGLIKAQWVER